jgi:hypothetical protein
LSFFAFFFAPRRLCVGSRESDDDQFRARSRADAPIAGHAGA